MRRVTRVFACWAVTVSVGCASTWDVASSRRFRDDPFGVMFGSPPDAMAVLRNPESTGDERARALQNLSEPGGGPVQDEALQLVSDAATADPSPWVRLCAVEALGQFQDPRTTEILVIAYRRATGAEPTAQEKESLVAQVGVRPSAQVDPAERLRLLAGPQGFSDDQVTGLRTKVVDALSKSGRPEAIRFLATVAEGNPDRDAGAVTDSEDRVRRAAVAGLGKISHPDAAAALAKVLTREQGRDSAVVGLAHAGLVGMTGKNYPADSGEWNSIVQASAQTR